MVAAEERYLGFQLVMTYGFDARKVSLTSSQRQVLSEFGNNGSLFLQSHSTCFAEGSFLVPCVRSSPSSGTFLKTSSSSSSSSCLGSSGRERPEGTLSHSSLSRYGTPQMKGGW